MAWLTPWRATSGAVPKGRGCDYSTIATQRRSKAYVLLISFTLLHILLTILSYPPINTVLGFALGCMYLTYLQCYFIAVVFSFLHPLGLSFQAECDKVALVPNRLPWCQTEGGVKMRLSPQTRWSTTISIREFSLAPSMKAIHTVHPPCHSTYI